MKRPTLLRNFAHALEGFWSAICRERNLRIHLFVAVSVLALALWLRISTQDWAVLILTIAVVIAAELINTSLEAVVDLASPELHDLAKLSKDTAAAAVFVLAIASVIVGLLILGPTLYARLF